MTTAPAPVLSELDQLEAEGIHIIREVAAEFEKPVLLFSGGKDSIVMLALGAQGISRLVAAAVPRCMHVDTGHNFDGGAGRPGPNSGRRTR